jgi:hypothetical protein
MKRSIGLFAGILMLLASAMPSFAADPVRTPVYMVVFGSVAYNGAPVAAGDEVRGYTPDNLLVARYAVADDASDKYGFMPVYGDDTTTERKDGAAAGDTLRFVLYRASDGQEHPVQFQSIDRVPFRAGKKEIRLDLMF